MPQHAPENIEAGLARAIRDCGFSTRTNSVMRDSPYRTLADLHAATDCELLRLPNLGRVSLREIRESVSAARLISPEDDLVEWARSHVHLVRALICGEAHIVLGRQTAA